MLEIAKISASMTALLVWLHRYHTPTSGRLAIVKLTFAWGIAGLLVSAVTETGLEGNAAENPAVGGVAGGLVGGVVGGLVGGVVGGFAGGVVELLPPPPPQATSARASTRAQAMFRKPQELWLTPEKPMLPPECDAAALF